MSKRDWLKKTAVRPQGEAKKSLEKKRKKEAMTTKAQPHTTT